MKLALEKIVSGGQTGVDRAGLDAAIKAGLPVGGYCPKGRLTEDSTVPERYPLIEMTKGGYSARTEQNVVESDGTLILNVGKLSGGTKLTIECAIKHNKPYLVIQLDGANPQVATLMEWLERNNVRVLNVAGPRESKTPGVHQMACRFWMGFSRIVTSNHDHKRSPVPAAYQKESTRVFRRNSRDSPLGEGLSNRQRLIESDRGRSSCCIGVRLGP